MDQHLFRPRGSQTADQSSRQSRPQHRRTFWGPPATTTRAVGLACCRRATVNLSRYVDQMVPRTKVEELVRAHASLDEPTTSAIWIKRETDAPEVWLVEVIPAMTDDDKAEEPTRFNPGIAFPFPLTLIAGNRPSLESALRRSPDLAREIVSGTVLLDDGDATALLELARQVSNAA